MRPCCKISSKSPVTSRGGFKYLASLGRRAESTTIAKMLCALIAGGAGQLLGDACDKSCSRNLLNVFCDQERHTCECDPLFPVRLAPTVGCAKREFHTKNCPFNNSPVVDLSPRASVMHHTKLDHVFAPCAMHHTSVN
jgi:hypothetical protein